MNKIVILPSAKLVPLELQNEFGVIPTAMIPLDSRPALHYVAEYYQKIGFQLLVAAHESVEQIVNYCSHYHELAIKVFNVGETTSIGETLFNTLDKLTEQTDELIVNFADTSIAEDLLEGNVVCFSLQDDSFRWTTFQLDNDRMETINERWTSKNSHTPQNVFIGIFRIIDVSDFFTLLKETLSSPKEGIDPFYVAIQRYFNNLQSNRKTFQEVHNWRDFGHLDTYYATKKELTLNCRHFNDVHVDPRRGIIRKTSKNTQKLIDEIRWYLRLPVGLQFMAPRIFKYDLSYSDPSVEMEFYGYPALNDMYLFGNHDIGAWNQIFMAVEQIIQDMKTYRLNPEDKNNIQASMENMYQGKTIARLERVINDPSFASYNKETLLINGRECFGIKKVLRILPELLETSKIYRQKSFSIIHGDLCLSNILYDQRNRLVRLIDPRGNFGSFDIYGDPKYDIAKLCHSLEGDYDFLVNGLFDLKWESEDLFFQIHHQERHYVIKDLFHQWVTKNWRRSYPQIKLIESLLFLSMVPLHADRPRSQQALLARGLELFTEISEKFLSSDGE
jgi:hypothetical protein